MSVEDRSGFEGWCRRWAVGGAIVVVGALGVGRVASASASATEVAPDVVLEVEVDGKIAEAEDLRRWIDEEAQGMLAEFPKDPPRSGQVSIVVDGALYDYQVTLTARQDGEVVGEAVSWGCECNTEELLGKLRGELPGVVGLLEVVEEEVVEEEVEAEPVVVIKEGRPRRFAPLGAAGAAGVGLMVVGVSAVATGVAFVAIGVQAEPDASVIDERDFSTPGVNIAIAGGGLALTGALLFLLRERINPNGRSTLEAIVPTLDSDGRTAVTLTGRF